MGWLWSSYTASPAQETPSTPPHTSPSPISTPPSPSKPLSREESADAELLSFLREIEADVQPSSKKYNRVPRPSPSATPTHSISPSSNVNSIEPLSEQLLPTTMSCRTAFDAAFYCNSFGGRFNDLYRYGNLRSCSDTWNDFWFCMRTRGFGGETKAKAVKDHYRKKEQAKYGVKRGDRPNSEDVWRSRERKVEVGTAFMEDYEPFTGTDEDWNRREQERRRGVVKGSMG